MVPEVQKNEEQETRKRVLKGSRGAWLRKLDEFRTAVIEMAKAA